MEPVRVAIGSDHGGVVLKHEIVQFLKTLDCVSNVNDIGPFSADRVDYPDFAKLVCDEVTSKRSDFGIVVCGSGIGVSIAANKVRGIRCGLCHDHYSAKMCRLHNNCNVVALGERTTGVEVAKDIVDTFLRTPFEGGRHVERVNKIMDLEEGCGSCASHEN
eukprot:ANDGO_05961.mRNA.1 Putative sugar phosphate isomerase YwlF